MLVVLAAALGGCATDPHAREQRALAGKTVVITGATSGFGRGVALRMAQNDARVVICARDGEALAAVAREAAEASPGAQVAAVQVDVGRPDEMERLARTALERFGQIDVWINNAGVGALGRFEDIPLADQLRLLEVNLDGVLVGSYHAMRQFRQQGHGTLINIGSVEGRVPAPYQAAYVASKHAVVGLGAALNQELRLDPRARAIHVVTINPFATDTPFFDHAANYTGRTARSVLLDPPGKVVDVIVRAAVKPDPEIAVGYKGKASQASERISRTITEATMARILHDAQMEDAPPAPHTSGTLYATDGHDGHIRGGVTDRIAREDARKEGARKEGGR
jgi:short-subunit dehydrogenase